MPGRSIAGNFGSNIGCIDVRDKEPSIVRNAGVVMAVVLNGAGIYFDTVIFRPTSRCGRRQRWKPNEVGLIGGFITASSTGR